MGQQRGEALEGRAGETGWRPGRSIRWNPSAAVLYEEAVRRGEAIVTADGALACLTGAPYGRSPGDRYLVREPDSEALIHWGAVNRPMEPAAFDALARDMDAYLHDRELFAQDCLAGADPRYELGVRVVTEYAWHSLFIRNLLMSRTGSGMRGPDPGLTIVDAPGFRAQPSRHGTASEVVIALSLARRLVLIGGTRYAGEMKKSVFSVMNYLLPQAGVLSMHCSANVGARGDTALYFGLSGTGKTTLSSDPDRRLIGDDEHGWSDEGIFNIEGGCYAKTIRLSADAEPQIHAAIGRFGTVLENVVVDPSSRLPDLDDARHTENTRAAYPLGFIANVEPSARGGHPGAVVMLTADAFGVLPPIARLTPESAMYHFLSGYTAKVPGTEHGVSEPRATFSACFGAPFLPLPPARYAALLGERIAAHGVRTWLVNTGWTGGPVGAGRRMAIGHTRAMIRAALDGRLDHVAYERDPIFNVDVPATCPDVPAGVLRPRVAWPSEAAYLEQAEKVARMFVDNFTVFEGGAGREVRAAGPRG